ncbi:hypothetical protein ID866_10286 [Astraeus odoratus]|nr:hypothetical protein ID866_10286 [Astraeus odoratus]
MTWVCKSLELVHSKQQAGWHMQYQQTYRIATASPFPGLCQFSEGKGFKQWTGDDSKVLMKVSTTT